SSIAQFTSREGSGASIVALLAGLTLVALWNSTRERRGVWPTVSAAALGLGLASDPAFVVSGVVSLVAVVVAARLTRCAPSFPAWRVVASGWMVAVGGVAYLAGATLLGTSPFG